MSTQKPVLSQQRDMPSQLGRQSPERQVLLQLIPQGDPSLAGSLSRQTFDVPAHVGVAKHADDAIPHTVVFGAKRSAGHAADVPSQLSATSHTPFAARHVPLLAKPSGGQSTLPAAHVSARSQGPALTRQVELVAARRSAGHAAESPLQTSVTSHGPAATRHAVELPRNTLAGQVLAPPQVSATSQGPAAGRQTVLAGAAPVAVHAGTPPLQRIVPVSHGLPVAHGAPSGQPETQLPRPSHEPSEHVVPRGARASVVQSREKPSQ